LEVPAGADGMRNYGEADDIQLVFSGSQFFEAVDRVIDECAHTLHFQTYIFRADNTGMRILDGLKRAAARGVKVFFMVDAYGSFPFPKHVARDLRGAGIHFRLFSPFSSGESVFIGRRLHHKIIVADKNTGLIGGINIADKYNTANGNHAWLDFAVLIKGEVNEYLDKLCEQFYFRYKPKSLRLWENGFRPQSSHLAHRYLRFRRNDWIQRRNEIHKSYVEAILKSEHSIVMAASYFLPGHNLRRLLKEASQRGVKISIIMAGTSDIGSLRLAESYLYDFYLRYNIRLFEWTDSVMHGKAMVVDDTWATVGSYNLNFLSHYVSIELNADIIDKEFVGNFSKHLNDIMEHSCKVVELDQFQQRKNIFIKALRWLSYNFYRVLMAIAMRGKKYRTLTRPSRDSIKD
jgi:cardiolipin synthase